MSRAAELVSALRAAGRRVTSARARLLHRIAAVDEWPFCAETILHQQRDLSEESVDRATVYRTLRLLEEIGQLHAVGARGESTLYDFTPPKGLEYIYLACRRCSHMWREERAAELTALTRDDFDVNIRITVFNGICRACRKT